MKCVSVRELRSRSAAVWRSLAREKDLVVTAKGKPIAVLSATTTSTLKAPLAALRQAPRSLRWAPCNAAPAKPALID